MGENSDQNGQAAAQAMLDLFASVGATRFDVTLTTSAGEKDWYRRGVSLAELRRTLPGMLDAAATTQRNVIVRPHSPATIFIQAGSNGKCLLVRIVRQSENPGDPKPKRDGRFGRFPFPVAQRAG